MKRAEFSKATRRDAFHRANGRCEECGVKLFTGEAEYHHVLESFLGGTSDLENCKVLCVRCHREVTRFNRPAIDKTRRIADKAAGIRKRSRLSHSRLRRKVDGTVVDRETGERV